MRDRSLAVCKAQNVSQMGFLRLASFLTITDSRGNYKDATMSTEPRACPLAVFIKSRENKTSRKYYTLINKIPKGYP